MFKGKFMRFKEVTEVITDYISCISHTSCIIPLILEIHVSPVNQRLLIL